MINNPQYKKNPKINFKANHEIENAKFLRIL